MFRIRFSPAAEEDLENLLAWSERVHGEAARERYQALFIRAIRDVAENPERPGVVQRPELGKSARTYHLHFSRQRVESSMRVKSPRHLLLFRIDADKVLEVARVLHDSMELSRHLPDDNLA